MWKCSVIKFYNHKLHYVDNYTDRLTQKYSVLVKQLSVNKATYEYWSEIQELIESQEFLFARMPYKIRGNIYNPDDLNETVLGYFTVAGQTEKRIFADPLSLTIKFRHKKCFLGPGAVDRMGLLMDYYRFFPNLWPVYITELFNGAGMVPALPASNACLDCTELGGFLEKPDFWVE